jgi:hypothetical protein
MVNDDPATLGTAHPAPPRESPSCRATSCASRASKLCAPRACRHARRRCRRPKSSCGFAIRSTKLNGRCAATSAGATRDLPWRVPIGRRRQRSATGRHRLSPGPRPCEGVGVHQLHEGRRPLLFGRGGRDLGCGRAPPTSVHAVEHPSVRPRSAVHGERARDRSDSSPRSHGSPTDSSPPRKLRPFATPRR